jgi:hypothetical protein
MNITSVNVPLDRVIVARDKAGPGFRVFVDNNEPGRTAAKRAADVHTSIGRHVYLPSPPDRCGDWNDFLNLLTDRDGRDLPPPATAEDAA